MKIVFQNHKKPEWDLPTPGYFFHIKDPRIDSNNYNTYVLIGHYLIHRNLIQGNYMLSVLEQQFINYSGLRFLHLSNCESIIKANDIKKENENNK